MNRTMAYEAHLEKINALRNRAYDLDTISRAYSDYADDILRIMTKGALADQAAEDLAEYARKRAQACTTLASVTRGTADDMEKNGLE